MAIETIEAILQTRGVPGPRLSQRTTLPAGAARAVVGIVHGYADHAERYDRFAHRLAAAGYAVVALDLRGHGKSDGPRGSCLAFGDFVADVGELARLVADVGRGVPQFLFGHSFGGLVSTHAVLADPSPWRGLLLSAPYFELAMKVPRYKVLLGKVASKVAPHFGQPAGIRGCDVTHDAELARRYDSDPLIFKNASSRWFTESLAAQARLGDRIVDLALPVWVGFGTEDKLASLDRARAQIALAKGTDKTFVTYPGLYHEILNEPSWEGIADTMIAWIGARLAA